MARTTTRDKVIRLEGAEIPEDYRDILGKKGFAHVATIGPAGEPQSNPVWYDFDGTDLLISQTTDRQKYRNLGADPRVAISIADPDDPYRYLEIRGHAVIEPDEDNRLVDALAKKYLGKNEYPWHQPGDQRVVVRIRPDHFTHMG